MSRLIGAPPGYVGHDEGGQLTESIRRRPYNVVLLDEIEKAHPQILNLLLQLLDEGRLTDGQGKVVDFTNTVIILTSNLGAIHLVEAARKELWGGDGSLDSIGGYGGANPQQPVGGAGGTPPELQPQRETEKQIRPSVSAAAAAPEGEGEGEGPSGEELWDLAHRRVMGEVERHFRPEMLNRLDDIVIFNPLAHEQLISIADQLLRQLQSRLSTSKSKVSFTCSQDAKELMVRRASVDPAMGARPLRRYIEQKVVTEMSKILIGSDVGENFVHVTVTTVKDPNAKFGDGQELHYDVEIREPDPTEPLERAKL